AAASRDAATHNPFRRFMAAMLTKGTEKGGNNFRAPMTKRSTFLFNFLLAVALAHPAQAGELPVIGQAALTTPTRSEEQRDLGLDLLWLPLESRTSLTDYAGRNLPGAT